jgi:hypothetical protein
MKSAVKTHFQISPHRQPRGVFFALALASVCGLTVATGATAQAGGPDSYPGIRYESAYSESMGGVTVPLADEVGNSLFNNPAGLARSDKFKAEYLNLNLDANNNFLSNIGAGTTKMTTLSGLQPTLNANQNQIFNSGISELTALSWGGTNTYYKTVSQTIPTVGYGLSLARGVVRLGYSLQYVNESEGSESIPNSQSGAAFLSGLSQGHAFSHTASVNFVLPFQYLPTFSVVGRNLFGLHYTAGDILPRAQDASGLPADESMSVDMALGFTTRISGPMKANWYVQYQDATNSIGLPIMQKLGLGANLGLSQAFSVRAGFTGNQFSAGFGYKSEASEINLAWYHEQSPFPTVSYWDTRYTLQYKLYFQDRNTRNRDSERQAK